MTIYHVTKIQLYLFAIFCYSMGFILPKFFTYFSKNQDKAVKLAVINVIVTIYLPIAEIIFNVNLVYTIYTLWASALVLLIAVYYGNIKK